MLRALTTLLLVLLTAGTAQAQSMGLMPKFGHTADPHTLSTEEQQFLVQQDQQFKGQRKHAAKAFEKQGWQLLRQHQSDAAMQSFNKAWLLEANNGHALWGMGQIEANRGNAASSVRLFQEAHRLLGFDTDFSVDHARALSLAAIKLNDKKLSDEAFQRFANIYARAPKHTLNLQNWAIALYYTGQYREAWEKIKAAQATPHGATVDPHFVAALQAKMPRP